MKRSVWVAVLCAVVLCGACGKEEGDADAGRDTGIAGSTGTSDGGVATASTGVSDTGVSTESAGLPDTDPGTDSSFIDTGVRDTETPGDSGTRADTELPADTGTLGETASESAADTVSPVDTASEVGDDTASGTDGGDTADSETYVYFEADTGPSVTVNATDLRQTIDMVGGDMERSSKAIQDAQNKDEIIEWAFKDIKFNYCRVQFDKNQELVEGEKNWAFYDKQVATMKQIKAVNPTIRFFATMRSDYDGYGNDNNLPDWFCNYDTHEIDTDKYGIFLADYVEYMYAQGVPIHTMSIAKEWSGAFVKADVAQKVIVKLRSELENRGVPMPLISDQGFWSISQGITYIKKVAQLGSQDLYSSFCSHNYNNEAEKWPDIVDLAASLGKPLYNDEATTGGGGPSYGEERPVTKLIGVYSDKAWTYESGLKGEIFFEIWSRGINKETRSIYFPNKGVGRRMRAYYVMKRFANNLLDYTYVTTSVTELPGVVTMAFRKDNHVALWVINANGDDYGQTPIRVDGAVITGAVDGLYWTEEVPIEGQPVTVTPTGNRFVVDLPAESLTSYLFSVRDV